MVARPQGPPKCCLLMVSVPSELDPLVSIWLWLNTTSSPFFPGDADPWHVLSVTQPLGPSEPVILIPSASHCLDMAPERPSDSPSLRLARQVREKKLWVICIIICMLICMFLLSTRAGVWTYQILPTSLQKISQQLQTWLGLAKESQGRGAVWTLHPHQLQ